MMRVNYVLKRVKLNPIGQEIFQWIPDARRRVNESVAELLHGFGDITGFSI